MTEHDLTTTITFLSNRLHEVEQERDALMGAIHRRVAEDAALGPSILQAVLDAIKGTLDPHTQIADHPNVKFAQMERLKWEAENSALREAEARLARAKWVPLYRAEKAEAERDALKAQLEARSYDDEPDITIGAEPWTDEQIADMRAIATKADLRHALELVESSLGPPVAACPRCKGMTMMPPLTSRPSNWYCWHCGKSFDEPAYYREVL